MQESNPPVIFLVGPTAVGKSAIGIELALKLQGEIVTADSMQIYRGMDIGTAKPTREEQQRVPHHLLDILEVGQPFNVAQFRVLACSAISDICTRGKQAIVVGGSGLYVRSLTQGIFEGSGKDERLRQKLEALDMDVLRQRLMECDPVAAIKINANDRRRVIRALEFFMSTGTPISTQQIQWKARETILPRKICLIGLTRPREELYQRCETRVDTMFSQGFIQEVRQMLKYGLAQSSTASKAIGYAEMIRYLKDESTLDETIKLTKQRTRNFVKRQLTWFRYEPKVHWLEIIKNDTMPVIISKITEIFYAQH